MESIAHMIPYLVSLILGGAGGYSAARYMDKSRIQSAKSDANEILKNAEKEAETIKKESLLQAKDKLFQARADLENEIKERRSELSAREARLLKKEENLERKAGQLESKEGVLTKHEKEIDNGFKRAKEKEKEADNLVKKQHEKLEQLAGLSSAEARDILLKKVEDETRIESARIIRQIEEETHSQADKKAKEIVATAIGRYAGRLCG